MSKSRVVSQAASITQLVVTLRAVSMTLIDLWADMEDGLPCEVFTAAEARALVVELKRMMEINEAVNLTLEKRFAVIHQVYAGNVDKVVAEPEELAQLQLDDDEDDSELDTPLIPTPPPHKR